MAAKLPLEGVRVLDLSEFIAGPACTMVLGDLGAEVVKVERPDGGDSIRLGGPSIGGEEAYAFVCNRNKRSVCIDLSKPEGREILLRLAAQTDIFVESFRPGVAERLGVGYEDIRRARPAVIYCSVSGFGPEGPYRDRPALDPMIQALTGFLSITGEPGRPAKVPIPLADFLGAHHALWAILAAHIHRLRSGEGQHIDVAIYDAAVAALGLHAYLYWATGQNPRPEGTRHAVVVPSQLFPTKDRPLYIMATQRRWRNLCRALEREEWTDDPRFSSARARQARREELLALLEARLLERTAEEWTEAFQREGVLFAPVQTIGEVLNSPHTRLREMVVEMVHPKIGRVPGLGIPAKLRGTPARIRRPPPLLGEHTDEVLNEVGLQKRIPELRRKGVIR